MIFFGATVPGYIILSCQLGGWDNNNAGPQVNNQSVKFDYVRVWRGTSSTVIAVPTNLTATTANATGYRQGGLPMPSGPYIYRVTATNTQGAST